MSPDTAPSNAAKSATGFVNVVIPALAFLTWAGAAALAVAPGLGLNPWGDVELYGWEKVPVWATAGLLGLSAIFFGIALWRRDLPWAYAAVAPLIVLGTGAHLLRDRHLLRLLIFALCIFLCTEYLTALRRFQNIANATKSLEGAEAKPVKTFVGRYFILSIGFGVAFAGFLYAFILYLIPYVMGLVSERAQSAIETETAWGIIIFALVFFAVPLLGRYIMEGVRDAKVARALREKEAQAEAAKATTETRKLEGTA